MPLDLPDLDPVTRQYMLGEFDTEQAGHPFVPPSLSTHGRNVWPNLMRSAIESGDDVTVTNDLLRDPSVFEAVETCTRQGISRPRRVNSRQAAERLGASEFNTWYVRGLAARFLRDGINEVEVYRAAVPKWEIASCSAHEGAVVPVQVVYDGHRARYWPTKNAEAFAIPFQPGCHHSIRQFARLE